MTEDGLEMLLLVKYAAEHRVGQWHARFEDVLSFILDGLKRLPVFDPNNRPWQCGPGSTIQPCQAPTQYIQVPVTIRSTRLELCDHLWPKQYRRVLDRRALAGLNALGFVRNETPLAVASRPGHAEADRILLEHDADTKICDKYDWSPLERPSENGHVDVVWILLE